MVRAPCCQKVGLKKGPWSSEEDQILIDHIQRHGHANWRALPKQAGLLRCGKSCRLRWTNYLRPDIKRGNFTKEEEDAIINLHDKLGNKWSAIAAMLPGRTDNEIKNVWHTHLKKGHCPKEAKKTSRKKVRGSESKLDSRPVGAAKQGEVCFPSPSPSLSSSSSATSLGSASCPAAPGEVKDESIEGFDERFWLEALSFNIDSAEPMSLTPPEAAPAAEMFDEAFDFLRPRNSIDKEFWLKVFWDAESLDVQEV